MVTRNQFAKQMEAQGIYLVNFIVKAFIFDRNGTFEKERKKVCNLFTI